MSDEGPSLKDAPTNWWGALTTYTGPRWLLKHKPTFVYGDDGSVHVVVHPEDAHLFVDGLFDEAGR